MSHQTLMVGHAIDLTEAPGYAAYNDLDTAVVLAAMHAAGAHRLVLAGSMVIYGEDRYDCPGARPGEPRASRARRPWTSGSLSHAATTKAAQEYLVAAWARQNGGAAWALRYHNVYRPRMPRHTRTRHRVASGSALSDSHAPPCSRARSSAATSPVTDVPRAPRRWDVRTHSRSPPADPAELYGAVNQLSRHRAEQAAAAPSRTISVSELDEAGTGV